MRKKASKANHIQYSIPDIVIESIRDKKGEEIVLLDLKNIPDTITDNFIICHADNITQVRAIGNHILDEVKQKTGMHAFSKEGFHNCEWILIDYIDVVVHVFLKSSREFYQLEELWSDAKLKKIENY